MEIQFDARCGPVADNLDAFSNIRPLLGNPSRSPEKFRHLCGYRLGQARHSRDVYRDTLAVYCNSMNYDKVISERELTVAERKLADTPPHELEHECIVVEFHYRIT